MQCDPARSHRAPRTSTRATTRTRTRTTTRTIGRSRAATPAGAVLAALGLLCALAPGCASPGERWAEGAVAGVSYSVLYNVVLTTVDAEGFVVRYRDPQKGAFESEWVYGTSQRVVRGPSRRKVYARIEPVEGDRFLVRLRVVEEVIRKGGLMHVNVRESDDWEPFDDNYEDAEYLMARLMALIAAEGTPLPPAEQAGGTPLAP